MTGVTDSPDFRLREIALPAYGPTILSSLGYGAAMPMVALQARALGAGVGTAALVVALFGLGQLVTSLPAGAVVARLGERRALATAAVVEATAMVGAALATSVVVFGAAVAVGGSAWSVFLISRQGYMIDAVPQAYRARAMAALGGATRVGVFLGPLMGAALIGPFGISAVFLLAAVCALLGGVVALAVPDLGVEDRAIQREEGFASVASVVVAHRHVLLTLGFSVVILGASRSVRNGLIPLWADHIGIAPTTTSLVFALAAAVDILMFYPGGWLMDRHGRRLVAVPIVVGVAIACLALPWVSGVTGLAAVMILIAFANGLGSGIVMTMGADSAPVVGRAQFLGAWRLCGDIGVSGGPLFVSALSLVAPLAAVCVVVGLFGLAGAGWVACWTGRLDERLRRYDVTASE
jgi:MFS family permease